MSDLSSAHAEATYNDFMVMTGLEFLQKAILSGDQSPMAILLDMRVLSASDGTAQIKGIPSAKFYNPMMRIHGGYIASLLDAALGSAVLTKMPKGTPVGTVNLNVHFVRKIETATGPLFATGTVLHTGRTMLTAEAKVADEAGVLYAHGTGTFLVYPT